MKIASAADIAAIEAVPIEQRDWATDTYGLLRRAADRFGDAAALTWLPDATALDATQSWSFSELLAETTRAANVFHAAGCGPTDVIAYMMPNLPQTHFVLWGAEATGTAFAINPTLSIEMVMALLEAMRVKVLVVAPAHLPPEMLAGLTRALRRLDALTHVLTIGASDIAAVGETVEDFRTLQAAAPSDRLLSNRTFHPGDRSSAFCTGGTTGAPKVALRTHGAEAADAHMLAIVLEGQIAPGDRVFCGLPMFHVNAILVTGLAQWINGAHVILGPADGFRDRALVANFWRIVEHFRLALFSGVPTIYSTLLDVPIRDTDVSSLRVGVCGAAPMAVELFRRFEDSTGIRILEGYGLTETVCTATMNPVDGPRPVGSVGLRLPYQQIRIVSPPGEDGVARSCGVGEVGTIAIAGPNVFAGYANPAHTAKAWIDLGDGRAWLDSGDLGHIDGDGYLWLTGRLKELIIRGGHNIDPKMIEEAMHRHPAVALAAAVGRPDARVGEVPVVYVELRAGMIADTATLLSFAAESVPERAAIPKAVIVLDRLPVTPVGKLFKPALTLIEVERAIRLEAAAAGVDVRNLVVRQDARRGIVAAIVLVDPDPAFAATIDRYTFQSDIVAGASESIKEHS